MKPLSRFRLFISFLGKQWCELIRRWVDCRRGGQTNREKKTRKRRRSRKCFTYRQLCYVGARATGNGRGIGWCNSALCRSLSRARSCGSITQKSFAKEASNSSSVVIDALKPLYTRYKPHPNQDKTPEKNKADRSAETCICHRLAHTLQTARGLDPFFYPPHRTQNNKARHTTHVAKRNHDHYHTL